MSRGQSVLAVGSQLVHMCENNASTASVWAACATKLLWFLSKKNVSIKRSLKVNLADVGMAQCMNALADKAHKGEVPCTQWYAVHNMATLFNVEYRICSIRHHSNNLFHPSISCSFFSRAATIYVKAVFISLSQSCYWCRREQSSIGMVTRQTRKLITGCCWLVYFIVLRLLH